MNRKCIIGELVARYSGDRRDKMINIKAKNECCGCTACFSICPVKCITMEPDEEGFVYPVIDTAKCINCGSCDNICPIKNTKENEESCANDNAYAIQCKNPIILNKSTSGGFFTPLAQYVLNMDGVVFGVGYDENLKIVHKEAKQVNQVVEFCGSKYVQSDLKTTFKKIRQYLNSNTTVLFSGTPCQVEGLLSYLKKTYQNLITVDLICHGTPSPLLWEKYVDYQESKFSSKIKDINFRHKTYGYHSGAMRLVFESGKVYSGSARIDYMLKPFFSEISSRPSCYACSFKKKFHLSDFTIYDCWSAEKLNSQIQDKDLGFTNLMINSQKGKEVFECIRDQFFVYQVSLDRQIELDGSMVFHSAVANRYRKDFYSFLVENGLEETINQFIPVRNKDYIIENTKTVLYRVKILPTIKRIKKWIKK